MTTAELCDALGLQELKNRKWHVQGSIAIKGEGLYEVKFWHAAVDDCHVPSKRAVPPSCCAALCLLGRACACTQCRAWTGWQTS